VRLLLFSISTSALWFSSQSEWVEDGKILRRALEVLSGGYRGRAVEL
jgi:hypothetical protein